MPYRDVLVEGGGGGDAAPGRRPINRSAEVTLFGKRIFIVEDEALLSMMIEETVEDMGCVVAGMASRLDDGIEKTGKASVAEYRWLGN
jgi:hypothetical protein